MEIGLVPNRDNREPFALAYWTVTDIAASVQALVDAGGTVVQNVRDVGYGLLVANVKAPMGRPLGYGNRQTVGHGAPDDEDQ